MRFIKKLVIRMYTAFEICTVTNALYRKFDVRAALTGMSLFEFLLAEIRAVAARPTVDELRERIAGRKSVAPSVLPAEVVRRERDTR